MSKIFGDDDGADFAPDEAAAAVTHAPQPTPHLGSNGGASGEREGLWITITPTSSASPFFDTLLILVVSPLVTLTVVYALLILRAKIRRRRWRAPKSLVDATQKGGLAGNGGTQDRDHVAVAGGQRDTFKYLKLKAAKNGELMAADGKQINRLRSEIGFVFQNLTCGRT